MNSHSEEISRLAEAMEKENSKREVLRTLDCFMLDSSLRESAVGQPCNHTLEEKMAILEEVKKSGFEHVIVASFADMTTIKDEFLETLSKRGENTNTIFSFSDLVSCATDGTPDTKTIPIGITKMAKFNLRNPIFEIDLSDSNVDYKKFTMKDYYQVLIQRIQWTFSNLSKDAYILVNFRDFPVVANDGGS